MGQRGRSLKLFLVDGTPTGIITAELGVSAMRAVVASRTSLPELLKREEAGRTGIYLLVGSDPDRIGQQLIYVGEGDQVKTRLAQHDSDDSKEFFTRIGLIVAKDENLTKAHARYLESRLIAAVRAAGRARLVNGTQPDSRGLPEPEVADMERVLDEIEVLLPVLGFDVLQAPSSEDDVSSVSSGAPTTFIADIKIAKARAVERSGQFVVLKGSTAIKKESGAIPLSVKNTRAQMIEAGVLAAHTNPELLEFTQDVSFASPSGASAAIAGRSDNGRKTWRVERDGKSYSLWREEQLRR